MSYSRGKLIRLRELTLFESLYAYQCGYIIDVYGCKWIKMGCFIQRDYEWESNFWNNESEFPSKLPLTAKSKKRKLAYDFILNYIKIEEN